MPVQDDSFKEQFLTQHINNAVSLHNYSCNDIIIMSYFLYPGYVPDTDSELGTLTLNSPQEWMEKGYHGNLEQLPEMTSIQKNLIEDFQGNRK